MIIIVCRIDFRSLFLFSVHSSFLRWSLIIGFVRSLHQNIENQNILYKRQKEASWETLCFFSRWEIELKWKMRPFFSNQSHWNNGSLIWTLFFVVWFLSILPSLRCVRNEDHFRCLTNPNKYLRNAYVLYTFESGSIYFVTEGVQTKSPPNKKLPQKCWRYPHAVFIDTVT